MQIQLFFLSYLLKEGNTGQQILVVQQNKSKGVDFSTPNTFYSITPPTTVGRIGTALRSHQIWFCSFLFR